MSRRRYYLLAAAASLAACEIQMPTEPPQWEQEWQVPIDSVQVGVGDFLPTGIQFNQDSTRFLADIPGASADLSLAEMCGTACASFAGMIAPLKPAFRDTLRVDTLLPADLISVQVAGGMLRLRLSHTMEFDPLHPDAASDYGYILLRATSGGQVLAEDSLDGHDVAFTSADTLRPTLDVRPVAVANDVHVEMVLFSPDGGPTPIGADDGIELALEPGSVELSSATVAMGTVEFGPTAQSMEFDVDSMLVDQVESGALILDIDNPLPISGIMDLDFDTGFQTIHKSTTLVPAEQQDTVAFTGDELRTLLHAPRASVLTSGTVSATSGVVSVQPSDHIGVAIKLKLVLLIGGNTEGN